MRRTSLLLVALLLGMATTAIAQPSPEQIQQFQEKYKAKIEEAWFKDAGWTDDLATAMKNAASSGKMIVGYFQRSYSY